MMWLLGVLLGITLIAHVGLSGTLSYIFDSDITKITVLITLGFIVVSMRIGLSTYQSERAQLEGRPCAVSDAFLERIHWWESVFLSLGFIGTLLGFVYLAYQLGLELDDERFDPRSASRILLPGIGTSITTTLFGLLASLLLALQVRNLMQIPAVEPAARVDET
jgi:uncharacterized membrane protein YfcA